MNMKKTLVAVCATAVGLVSVSQARAADPPGTKRPRILNIFKEEVKPGRGPAHQKNEAGWPAALRKAGSKGYYLAMTSSNQAWYLNPWDSFAAADQEAKAVDANAALTSELDRLWSQDGEMLAKAGGMWTVYREDLSYRPDWDTAKMRAYVVTVMRLTPGYEREFAQIRKSVNDAHDKAKVDEQWAVYQVITGAPDDTFIFFSPLVSIAQWDNYEAMHGKEFQEAFGEDNRSRLRSFEKEAVKSSETEIFQFSPKMSYLPKEMAERDADFWMPKAAPAAGTKKEEKKP